MGLPLLAACGGDEGTTSGADPTSTPTTSPPESPTATSPSATATKSRKPPAGGIPTSEIPVGGGLVVPDDEIVITQPTQGEFVAFSSICTHQGCPVARVAEEIECDCHGSRYDIATGEPVGGPATQPLPPAEITVSGNRITVA